MEWLARRQEPTISSKQEEREEKFIRSSIAGIQPPEAGPNSGLQGPTIASRLNADRPNSVRPSHEEAWPWGYLRLGSFPCGRLNSWPT
ncbi:hypothetical protein HZ326_11776 [Fusarium oxysporum f. sp. albedinis]|nr:hypothetical protein HZ326_11776 [Fusarium oxysporum f. sp. albedinis]